MQNRIIRKHTERRGLCPFCPDTKGHLYMNEETKCWICFKCNRRGIGLDQTRVRWLSKKMIEIEGSYTEAAEIFSRVKKITGDNILALRYLSSHHIPWKLADDEDIGVLGSSLVIPVKDSLGSPVLVQTRNLASSLDRTKFRNYGTKSLVLPFYDNTHEVTGKLCVVESILSAIRLSTLIPAVALCGKNYSQYQLEAIRALGFGRHVLVWLDDDAVCASFDLVNKISSTGTKVSWIISHKRKLEKTDPCDLTDKEIKTIIGSIPK